MRLWDLVSIEIIVFSFIFIGENFIGLGYLSELLFSLLSVVRVFIRMPLDGKFPVGLFDLLIVSFLLDAEDLVKASFDGH